MEGRKIFNRNLFIVLVIILLIFFISTIAYAVFNFASSNGSDNKIITGTIAMTYQEPESALEIENAMPVASNDTAKTGAEYFEFQVSARVTGKTKVPYTIDITEDAANTLAASKVRLYLTSVNGETETQVMAPTLASNLDTTPTTLRVGAKTLYSGEFDFTGVVKTETITYRLRMWIDAGITLTDSDNSKTYKMKVNVDSKK